MQQRLAIAQALLKKPKLLLLDEPFGALDPGIRRDMHELLLALWEEIGMTVLMVTHDIAEAFKLGTRLIVFDKVRHDPHAPTAYGATITYDLPLRRPVDRRDRSRRDIGSAARTLDRTISLITKERTDQQGRHRMILGTGRGRRRRYAGLAQPRDRSRRHHPDFNARETRGWKAVEAEGGCRTTAGGANSNGRSTWACPAPTA